MGEIDLDALEKRIRTEETFSLIGDDLGPIYVCSLRKSDMAALLALARRAADAERERDEARDDYLRRHKDACDRYEEIEALKSRLAALKEKCAPFVRALEEGDNVPGQSKADNRSSFQMVRVSDLRELARAVNGEEKQEAGE